MNKRPKNYKWNKYNSKLKKDYENIYNDYNNCELKIKEIMIKYKIKSVQTVYNIIKIVDNEKKENRILEEMLKEFTS